MSSEKKLLESDLSPSTITATTKDWRKAVEHMTIRGYVPDREEEDTQHHEWLDALLKAVVKESLPSTQT